MPVREGHLCYSSHLVVAYFKLRFGDFDPLCALDVQNVLDDECVGLVVGVIKQESATESPTRSHSLSPILDLTLEQKRGCWSIGRDGRKLDSICL